MKEIKRIPTFNSNVDIAGFEKVGDDQYIFTKENFFGFKDHSIKHILNSLQRKNIRSKYIWCWTILLVVLFTMHTRSSSDGTACYYISEWFCNDKCLVNFTIPISIIFYRLFTLRQYHNNISKYPLYTKKLVAVKTHHFYTLFIVFLIGGTFFYLGLECLIKK